MSIYHCENITVQWCLVAESLFQSHHGGNHGFGGIWGSNKSSYHHNLLAHHSGRNPRFASGCGNTDYRNNVIYNWGYSGCYGGEKQQKGNDKFNFTNINMVANYYKAGPATAPGNLRHTIASPSSRDGLADLGKWFIADNYVEGNDQVTANNWDGGVSVGGGSEAMAALKLDKPWPAMAINQQTAKEAYEAVLKNVGAILPKRDSVDARIIQEVRDGVATYEGAAYKEKKKVADKSVITGIIDSQKEVGGWPELKSIPAPADTDLDGMPDAWEKAHGLMPTDPSDGPMDRDGDGYTNVEEYLNGLAAKQNQ
jgi:pectate lyase